MLTGRKPTLPPPVAPQPREQSLPNIDPRLLTPSTISHEAAVPSPETASQQRQQSFPTTDPRLGFLAPPTTPRQTPSAIPRQIPSTIAHQISPVIEAVIPSPEIAPPTRLSRIPAPRLVLAPRPIPAPRLAPATQLNESESEFEGSDIDGMQNYEPDIDERSDDEDDRAAHELLRQTPVVMPAVTSTPGVTPAVTSVPPVLSYNHDGFSVSCRHLC